MAPRSRATRERWRTVDTPGGAMAALLPPVESTGWDPAMGRVPALGAHTAAVRAEFAESPATEEVPA